MKITTESENPESLIILKKKPGTKQAKINI